MYCSFLSCHSKPRSDWLSSVLKKRESTNWEREGVERKIEQKERVELRVMQREECDRKKGVEEREETVSSMEHEV